MIGWMSRVFVGGFTLVALGEKVVQSGLGISTGYGESGRVCSYFTLYRYT